MDEVFQGCWINWTHGRIKGATLTLSNERGTYLVAFLALFVQLVGSSCWAMIAKAMFALPAAREFRIITRNDTSPGLALVDLAKLWRLQHRMNSNRKVLTLSTLSLAFLNIVGFIIAGIFSSRVVSTRSGVLLRPTKCGIWQGWGARNKSRVEPATDAAWEIEKAFHFARDTANFERSNSHVATCRGTTSSACLPLGTRWVNLSTTFGTPCPFHATMCQNGLSATFDTGKMDSLLDMGINTPSRDRISLQIVLRCAPIESRGYSEFYDSGNISLLDNPAHIQNLLSPQPLDGIGFIAFFYGNKTVLDLPASFVYVNDSLTSMGGTLLEYVAYKVDSLSSDGSDRNDTYRTAFAVIPQLAVHFETTHLFFITNHVQYAGPVGDPIFRAEQPVTYTTYSPYGTAVNYTLWNPVTPVSVLGCTQKTEICVHDQPDKCAPLRASSAPFFTNSTHGSNLTRILSLTSRQESVLVRLQDALRGSQIHNIPWSIGGSGLLARQYTAGNMSAPLPDDQWVREVENWMATSVANMQLAAMQFVTGLPQPEWNHYLSEPDSRDKWMCHTQIVQRQDFMSFSVLGLALILGFGGLIIILDLLPPCGCGRKKGSQLTTEWRALDLLDLAAQKQKSIPGP